MSGKKESKEKNKTETKKRSAKKTTKKESSKKENSGLLREIKPEEYFLLCDGLVLKNIYDLIDALETMSDDVFYYHVNDERNDFFNWLKDVFHEEELAQRILGFRNPLRVEVEILKELVNRLKS
ncbi:MAG: hypothetical protein PWQ28_241 [Candidatus Woesearchaeota archaeon]|nr:hypothetical protein [Candidatus Woesearchaeota archaeon]